MLCHWSPSGQRVCSSKLKRRCHSVCHIQVLSRHTQRRHTQQKQCFKLLQFQAQESPQCLDPNRRSFQPECSLCESMRVSRTTKQLCKHVCVSGSVCVDLVQKKESNCVPSERRQIVLPLNTTDSTLEVLFDGTAAPSSYFWQDDNITLNQETTRGTPLKYEA